MKLAHRWTDPKVIGINTPHCAHIAAWAATSGTERSANNAPRIAIMTRIPGKFERRAFTASSWSRFYTYDRFLDDFAVVSRLWTDHCEDFCWIDIDEMLWCAAKTLYGGNLPVWVRYCNRAVCEQESSSFRVVLIPLYWWFRYYTLTFGEAHRRILSAYEWKPWSRDHGQLFLQVR